MEVMLQVCYVLAELGVPSWPEPLVPVTDSTRGVDCGCRAKCLCSRMPEAFISSIHNKLWMLQMSLQLGTCGDQSVLLLNSGSTACAAHGMLYLTRVATTRRKQSLQ
jgi:hypothetical protein